MDIEAKEQAEMNSRKAQESFPTLAGPGTGSRSSTPTPQTRKVLSLNSQTKKVSLSTYSTQPKMTSSSKPATPEPEIVRIAAPKHSRNLIANQDKLRRWQDPNFESLKYIPLVVSKLEKEEGSAGQRKSQRKPKKQTPTNTSVVEGSSSMPG
jgi:ribosomal protein L28